MATQLDSPARCQFVLHADVALYKHSKATFELFELSGFGACQHGVLISTRMRCKAPAIEMRPVLRMYHHVPSFKTVQEIQPSMGSVGNVARPASFG
jgi:hypothetical protein